MKPCHFVATGYIVRDGKTLLVKHKKLHLWLPPGGHIEEGENPDAALRRELLEEVLGVHLVAGRLDSFVRLDSLHRTTRSGGLASSSAYFAWSFTSALTA